MGRVLVAVGWECDERAVEATLRLLDANHDFLFMAVQEGGEGTLPLAATGPAVLPPVVMPDPDAVAQAQRLTEQQGYRYLESVAAALDLKADFRVESGDPAERICATAAEQDVDLVVIGSSDANFVQRILGGSTSDQVAHQAPCPVLLVRHGEPGGHRLRDSG